VLWKRRQSPTPQVSNPHSHRCENLKTRTIKLVYVIKLMGDETFLRGTGTCTLTVTSCLFVLNRTFPPPLRRRTYSALHHSPILSRTISHPDSTSETFTEQQSLKNCTITHNDAVKRRNVHAANELAKGQTSGQ
jgi:hypothetical protein